MPDRSTTIDEHDPLAHNILRALEEFIDYLESGLIERDFRELF